MPNVRHELMRQFYQEAALQKALGVLGDAKVLALRSGMLVVCPVDTLALEDDAASLKVSPSRRLWSGCCMVLQA